MRRKKRQQGFCCSATRPNPELKDVPFVVDLAQKGMAAGELRNVAARVGGIEALIDRAGKRYLDYVHKDQFLEQLLGGAFGEGNEVAQFRSAATEAVVHPTGPTASPLIYPYAAAKRAPQPSATS